MNNKTLVSLTIAVLSVFIFIGLVFYKVEHVQTITAVTIDTSNQPKIGSGDITMIAFEDMKCTNCKIYNDRLYSYIKSQYIDTGKASYIIIPLAFLPNSAPAGNAALCVFHQSPALFFDYIDYLYTHQPDEALDWATSDILLNFAGHLSGINLASLKECMEQHQYYTQLQQNLSLASKIMGDTVQTPSLYVNGRLVSPLTKEEVDRMVSEPRNLE